MKVNMVYETAVGGEGIFSVFNTVSDGLEEHSPVEVVKNSDDDDWDLLHSHTLGPLTVVSARLEDRPTVVTAHMVPELYEGTFFMAEHYQPLIARYLRFAYNSFDNVVALSDYIADRLEEMGVDEEKITIIPNAVNPSRKRSQAAGEVFRDEHGIGSDLMVLSVGSLIPRKGVETFCEVAEEMPGMEFVWVGPHPQRGIGAGQGRVRRLVEEGSGGVHFTGFVDDVRDAYEAADIFFFPSHRESFGLSVLEAARAGLPIILRDNPEYRGIYDDLALVGDSVEDFVSHMKTLEDQDKRQEYAERAREIVAERFSLEEVVVAHEELYRDCMDG